MNYFKLSLVYFILIATPFCHAMREHAKVKEKNDQRREFCILLKSPKNRLLFSVDAHIYSIEQAKIRSLELLKALHNHKDAQSSKIHCVVWSIIPRDRHASYLLKSEQNHATPIFSTVFCALAKEFASNVTIDVVDFSPQLALCHHVQSYIEMACDYVNQGPAFDSNRSGFSFAMSIDIDRWGIKLTDLYDATVNTSNVDFLNAIRAINQSTTENSLPLPLWMKLNAVHDRLKEFFGTETCNIFSKITSKVTDAVRKSDKKSLDFLKRIAEELETCLHALERIKVHKKIESALQDNVKVVLITDRELKQFSGELMALQKYKEIRPNKESNEGHLTLESYNTFLAQNTKRFIEKSVLICKTCGPTLNKLFVCGRCKVAKYCSVECQRKDWNTGHKEACKLP